MGYTLHIRSSDKKNSGGALWQNIVAEHISKNYASKTFVVRNFSRKRFSLIKRHSINYIVFEHPYNLIYALPWFLLLKLWGHVPQLVYSMHNDERALFWYGARKQSFYNYSKFVIADALATTISSAVIAPKSLQSQKSITSKSQLITIKSQNEQPTLTRPVHGSIRLTFIGSSFWKPNRDGILAFLSQFESYASYIKRVTIVGDGWQSIVPENKKIYCTGYVQDLSAITKDTDVFIAPIEHNFGVNVKLYEYLNYGKPILSTHEASCGIESPLITNLDLQYWRDYFHVICNND